VFSGVEDFRKRNPEAADLLLRQVHQRLRAPHRKGLQVMQGVWGGLSSFTNFFKVFCAGPMSDCAHTHTHGECQGLVVYKASERPKL